MSVQDQGKMGSQYHAMELGHKEEMSRTDYMLDEVRTTQAEQGCFGRVEDCWKSFSTPYFAILGFTIHEPLTTEQKEDLKELGSESGNFPRWIIEITSLPNVGIATSYFCAGFSSNFLQVPLMIYCLESLSADATYMATLYRFMWIPWFVKVVLGLISDSFLCCGLRRKPYLTAAWLIFFITSICQVILPMPLNSGVLLLLVGLQTLGWSWVLVVLDAIVVERSKFEVTARRGKMLTIAYVYKFSGALLGAILGNALYMENEEGWRLPIRWIFLINAAFPLLLAVPFISHLEEIIIQNPIKSASQPLFDVVETLQLDAVWKPLLFFMIYNAFQWTASSRVLFFAHNPALSTASTLISSGLFVMGLLAFLKLFFDVNWHTLIIVGTAIVAVVEMSEGGLVSGFESRWDVGESTAVVILMFLTALGGFAQAIMYLPMHIIFAAFCPLNAEATMFSLLKGLARAAAPQTVTTLGSLFPTPEALQINADAVAEGDYSAVWKRSLVTGLVCLLPLLLIVLIPRNSEELTETLQVTERTAKKGIIIAVILLICMSVVGSFLN